ncbi:MAG TPA: COX15/CtaA family protein [Solirubrobacterales bacterium]|jgi:cytochrome c oxidase assembly protein subunit 15
MRDRLRITPQLYATVALVALGALSLIVLTGAGVRLTGSGLGCPDWPKCYGQAVPPLDAHAVIEFGNRVLTGFVGFAVIAASILAWFRRPFRGHLALFGALLPLGVIGQAVLGGEVVKHHLAPGLVMSHFILSMLLLDASFALAWCARYEPWERRRSSDRLGVWAVRALVPLGQMTIAAGTVATASGPHAGAHAGQLVRRFDFEGSGTLEWVVQRHAVIAAVFGFATIAVWLLLRRPGGDNRAVRPLTAVIGLLALQGVVGGVQWALKLPSEIVWVHVALAVTTWLAVLWTVATAGRLEPRKAHSDSEPRQDETEMPAPALSQS